MSQDKTKTSKTDGVFKNIHRRMSNFGKLSGTSKSPYETISSVADQLPSSHSSSPLSSALVREDQHRLWHAEKDREVFRNVDPLVVYVAAMVHDIGDGKYLSDELVKMETDEADQEQQRDFIESFIRESAPECPPYIWGPASHVAALVSFTREIRNPIMVAQQCAAYPALQLVQDADRLDGLGAVGIVRGAVYGGVTEPRGTGTVRRVVHIADERHARYPEMMKTRAGKKEAAKRWEAMKEIRNQIVQQANCEDVLEEY